MTMTLIPALTMIAGAAWAAIDPQGARALARVAIASTLALAGSIALTVAPMIGGDDPGATTLLTLLLTGFIGMIVTRFSQRYLRADPDRRGYAVKVALLLGAVMAFAVARDVVTLAIGWTASGWALAALIGHRRDWQAARQARRTTLISFAIGDIALIAALAIYAASSGSLALSPETGIAEGAATPVAALLLVAAMARCALPPFHRWLGRSMTAPTPVSALMHAGFVNGGGVLLIRFAPVLEAAPAVRAAAIAIGMIAALAGTAIMLVRPDIKRSLAGSTVAQMGFMVMSCGLGAYAAALWHLIAHGLFKAWLFLRSGSAIGVGAIREDVSPKPLAIATIGGGAIAVAALLAVAGLPQAAVPIALALASILAALPGLVTRPALLPIGLAVTGSYLLGLWSVERWLAHPLAAPLGGDVLPVAALPAAIVAIFAAAWLIQALIARGKLPLPAALHARLLAA